jgi:hypothetical protein
MVTELDILNNFDFQYFMFGSSPYLLQFYWWRTGEKILSSLISFDQHIFCSNCSIECDCSEFDFDKRKLILSKLFKSQRFLILIIIKKHFHISRNLFERLKIGLLPLWRILKNWFFGFPPSQEHSWVKHEV